MKATLKKLTGISLMREVCETIMKGRYKSRVTMGEMARLEHSPLRTQTYLLKMENLNTFVSVHLVRHKHGVEHFVGSNRDDRGGGDFVADRNTPIPHDCVLNAQALINMATKRLCYKSHTATVAAMQRIKNAVAEVDPELEPYLVPDCVRRNGLCPETRICHLGVDKVLSIYPEYNDLFPHKASWVVPTAIKGD